MRVFIIILVLYAAFSTQALAQNSNASNTSKDWTAWAEVDGNWAEFYVFTNFTGGNKTPEQLAKKELKSLKVDCFIIGRIRGTLPPDSERVKVIRVLYSQYGKYADMDLKTDVREVYYDKNGQVLRAVTITRPASQFDVDETAKPVTETVMTTNFPTIISMMGVDPKSEKISGHRYRVKSEWRRKGSTIEVRLKDYRP